MITRRRFTGSLPVAAAVAAAGKPLLEGTAAWAQPAAAAGHFDPKGKRPSTFTIEALNKARDTLPFADQRAFEEQRKGLVAAMPDRKIMAAMDGRERHRHPAHIYTLRGAPVRDPLNWSKFIGQALYRFGREAEVMFASHHWPRWGKARIQEVPRGQRDLYANMNNQVLHLADKPDLTVTINRADLKPVMDGARTLEQQIASGLMKVDGDVGVLTKLASTIVDFDPRFQIMRGTKIRDGAIPAAGAYEVMPRNTISE